MESKNIYHEGFEAFQFGMPYQECPLVDAQQAEQWKTGWMSANWQENRESRLVHLLEMSRVSTEESNEPERNTIDAATHVFLVSFAAISGLGLAFVFVAIIYNRMVENGWIN